MTASKRIASWLIAIPALIAIGLALDRVHRAQEADEAATVAGWQRDGLRRQLQRTEERLVMLEREDAERRKIASPETGEAAAASEAERLVTEKKNSTQAKDADPRIVAARDPALRVLHLEAFAEDIDGVWGPLFAQLNLSAEKIAQFKAILLEHERNRLDVTAVAGEQKLSMGDPAIQQQRSDDGAVLAQKMRALLGPGVVKIYNQYHHDLGVQPIVAEIAGKISFTETPLNLSQAQNLMMILSDSSEKRAHDFVRPNTVDWDAALAQVEANPAFSPALRNAFQGLYAQKMINPQLANAIEAVKQKTGAEDVFLFGSDLIHEPR